MDNLATSGNLEIFDLIASSDMVSKVILLGLSLASVWLWAIIFDKIVKFHLLKTRTEKFEKIFWSGQMIEDLFEKVKLNVTHPFAALFVAVMHEWNLSNAQSIDLNNFEAKETLRYRMQSIAKVAVDRSGEKLSTGLGFLATVSAAAPLCGLFGTVWGIVNTFLAVSSMGNANLVIVAPGIAEALVTTIFGLIAAIPASIAFNYYTNKMNRFLDKLDNFSSELLVILSRELDK